jgi:hypothetical protein
MVKEVTCLVAEVAILANAEIEVEPLRTGDFPHDVGQH